MKRSVFPDHLVCLEDGKRVKLLKRHLATAHQLTPDEYRERWRLPASYPMVAQNYSETRSKLAKQVGLGHFRGKQSSPPTAPAVPVVPSRRGRKKAGASLAPT